ncbi:MAG: hypothetical protein LBR85_06265 [Oscillospiraceae bacterium]|jgi:hypothetical protein|nr:hypothetical protein [Oscillospiraceae bacterium]
MAQKKAVIAATAFLLVALLSVGLLSLAADVGGKDDPMVGLSYLSQIEDELMKDFDALIDTRYAEFSTLVQDKIAEAKRQLDDLQASGGGAQITEELIKQIADEVKLSLGSAASGSGDAAQTYARVQVKAGQTILFGEGTSFYLRTGEATVYKKSDASQAGLIDLTDGSVLDSGTVKPNHLYSVTFVMTRGFKASSDVWVFVLGPYEIS